MPDIVRLNRGNTVENSRLFRQKPNHPVDGKITYLRLMNVSPTDEVDLRSDECRSVERVEGVGFRVWGFDRAVHGFRGRLRGRLRGAP